MSEECLREEGVGSWVIACSHGGHVICVDGATGVQRWLTLLPGRCEAGMAVARDLRSSPPPSNPPPHPPRLIYDATQAFKSIYRDVQRYDIVLAAML